MAEKIKPVVWLGSSKVRRSILTFVWVGLVVLVVVPTWKGVIQRNSEIHDLETRLATMDDWTVAGMWLAQSVNERSLPVNAAFSRLFPGDRGREELFLSLARVADNSGVENFSLSETSLSGMESNDVWGDGSAMSGGQEASPGADGAMDDASEGDAMALSIPTVDLSSYRVKARFSGDYKRIAHFMTDLKKIERALKVHNLVIQPQRDGIQVDLELDIYVSKTSQS